MAPSSSVITSRTGRGKQRRHQGTWKISETYEDKQPNSVCWRRKNSMGDENQELALISPNPCGLLGLLSLTLLAGGQRSRGNSGGDSSVACSKQQQVRAACVSTLLQQFSSCFFSPTTTWISFNLKCAAMHHVKMQCALPSLSHKNQDKLGAPVLNFHLPKLRGWKGTRITEELPC